MERQGLPDQDQLLQFLKRLKEVFDVCDEDADGFIRVEHLMDLGLQFGQGDEVKKLTKHLCPNAHGKINFKEFCHAVFAIKGFEEILKMAVIPRSQTSQHQSVTDNGYIYQCLLVLLPTRQLEHPPVLHHDSSVQCWPLSDRCVELGVCLNTNVYLTLKG